jgi:release factor glutamine methyltransferase
MLIESLSRPNARGLTVAATLNQAIPKLRTCMASPQLEAELLLIHILGLRRSDLYAHPERLLNLEQLRAYEEFVERRVQGEPLPYLTGHIEFYGLDLNVDPRVLIPRPETETLVELALSEAEQGRPLSVVDVGTGSGCIAIALAVHRPRARLYALDLSAGALHVARSNAQRFGVTERIAFIQSDLLTAVRGPVDLIVSNPPYVAGGEWSTLAYQVAEHEPQLALYGGTDGLSSVRRLLNQARGRLRPGGVLLIEMGATQGAAVVRLARNVFPQDEVVLHADLAGRDRVLRVVTCAQGIRDG